MPFSRISLAYIARSPCPREAFNESTRRIFLPLLQSSDSRTVRVIGDSFSEYYMPYLQARFTNSWREHIDTFTMDVAGHPGCDILILEFNERSLDKLLAILEQF